MLKAKKLLLIFVLLVSLTTFTKTIPNKSSVETKTSEMTSSSVKRKLGEIRILNEEEASSSEGEEGEGEGEEEEEEEEEVVIHLIIYVLITLIVGSFMRFIHLYTKIPLFTLIVIAGVIVGFIAGMSTYVRNSIDVAHSINAETLLLLFLPVIIFESAFNSDLYVMWKSKWQLLLLAGPVSIIHAFIVCGAILYVFGYSGELTFLEALAIASIVSTTDPISVVPLLEQLGARTSFNVLLEGESHFVDATALVLFLICKEAIEVEDFTAFDGFKKFLWLVVGGPIFGLFFGFFVTIILA